jgi:hypothetical protein
VTDFGDMLSIFSKIKAAEIRSDMDELQSALNGKPSSKTGFAVSPKRERKVLANCASGLGELAIRARVEEVAMQFMRTRERNSQDRCDRRCGEDAGGHPDAHSAQLQAIPRYRKNSS